MVAENPAALQLSQSAPAIDLKETVMATRKYSERLAEPLTDEDKVVQAMDDASPTKWHLAHTTWFFEAFVLEPNLPGYVRSSNEFHYCFNSYYENAGPRHPRPKRGLLTRPSCSQVMDYRNHVDEALEQLFEYLGTRMPSELFGLLELGINHEQQHQELILTDILSVFAQNPLRPAYKEDYFKSRGQPSGGGKRRWIGHPGGIRQIGTDGPNFHYDNEGPSHPVLLRPFQLASDLVTNGEWLAFMSDGGYETATLWLSDGWAKVQLSGWSAPGYWERIDGEWRQMTLAGLTEIDPNAPVSNVSYYEADAFARWCGKRLPTEFEWEVALSGFQDKFLSAFGELWQWTSSAYSAYPGYKPVEGAIGEYNGKFMCSQYVLRGASHATSPGHSRLTYRNFFYPDARWQFTGLRLAEDAK